MKILRLVAGTLAPKLEAAVRKAREEQAADAPAEQSDEEGAPGATDEVVYKMPADGTYDISKGSMMQNASMGESANLLGNLCEKAKDAAALGLTLIKDPVSRKEVQRLQ